MIHALAGTVIFSVYGLSRGTLVITSETRNCLRSNGSTFSCVLPTGSYFSLYAVIDSVSAWAIGLTITRFVRGRESLRRPGRNCAVSTIGRAVADVPSLVSRTAGMNWPYVPLFAAWL